MCKYKLNLLAASPEQIPLLLLTRHSGINALRQIHLGGVRCHICFDLLMIAYTAQEPAHLVSTFSSQGVLFSRARLNTNALHAPLVVVFVLY